MTEEKQTSYCSDCGEHRPVSEFWRNSSSRDGYQIYCIKHHKIRVEAYKAKNPGVNAKYVRKWEEENPDMVRVYAKRSAENRKRRMREDPEYAEKIRRQWREAHARRRQREQERALEQKRVRHQLAADMDESLEDVADLGRD